MVIIVSAVIEEASPTLELFAERGIRCEHFALGVGPLHAARAGVKLAAVAKGKPVIYIGSAGCYYSFTGPHLVGVTRVLWSPTGERYGLAQRPEWLYPPLELRRHNSLGLAEKTVLTSTGITVTDEALPSSCDLILNECVENMELYACADALQEAASELTIVLGITNQIGSMGRGQWLQNRNLVAQLTAEALSQHYS
jgi:hypothetical protein